MHAYHNDPNRKAWVVALMRWHRTHDHLIQGTCESLDQGYAMDCILYSLAQLTQTDLRDNHDTYARYETLLGVPRVLARLQNLMFEVLPVPENVAFVVDFLEAIPVGADLSLVWPHLAVWLLTDPIHGITQYLGEQRPVAKRVADLYRRQIAGTKVKHRQWRKARTTAMNAITGNINADNTSIYGIASVLHAAETATNADASAASVVYAADAVPRIFWPSFRDELLRLLAAAPLAGR